MQLFLINGKKRYPGIRSRVCRIVYTKRIPSAKKNKEIFMHMDLVISSGNMMHCVCVYTANIRSFPVNELSNFATLYLFMRFICIVLWSIRQLFTGTFFLTHLMRDRFHHSYVIG